jgi:hypothetical protein
MRAYLAISLLVALFAGADVHAQVGSPSVSGQPVTVSGRLRSKVVFGPPGFGETPRVDSKVKIYYVELRPALTPKQLALPSSNGDQKVQKTYAYLQLWCGNDFASCETFLQRNKNRSVLVSGITSYALEANDRYPVTMTVGALDLK